MGAEWEKLQEEVSAACRERLRAAGLLLGRGRSGVVLLLIVVVAAGAALNAYRSAPRPERIEIASPARASRPVAARRRPAMIVHVCGAVRHPGVYEFAKGDRIINAVRRAGGPTAKADLDTLNLAAELRDGEKVQVPVKGQAPAAAGGMAGPAGAAGAAGGVSAGGAGTGTPGAPGAAGPLVSLNSAGLTELDSLPGVGPVMAQRILEYRQAHGSFKSVDELQSVDGIGPKKFAQLKDRVTVD